MECVAEEPVEKRACCADVVRGAHLAEDLALPRHHRVEPGCNAEEMERRCLVAEAIERRPELLLEREQRRLGLALGLVGRVISQIQLGAVARREADGLAALAREPQGELARAVRVERCALPQLDGSLVVRDADEDDAHAKCVTGRASLTTTTSANPVSTR